MLAHCRMFITFGNAVAMSASSLHFTLGNAQVMFDYCKAFITFGNVVTMFALVGYFDDHS